MSEELKSFPHHRKVGPCTSRPPYRDSKRKRAVKVFTIADESMYLLIFGVPSIDLLNPLKERIQQIESMHQFHKVTHPESEAFTETYIAKFGSVNSARNVKRRLDDSPFYGGFLHIVYAPEFESVAECRVKMHSYRRFNDTVARKATAARSLEMKECQRSSLNTEKTEVGLEVNNELQTSSCISLQTKQVSAPPLTTSWGDPVSFSNPYSKTLPMVLASQNQQQRGDALDDARNYWASRGFDFPDSSKHHPIHSAQPKSIPFSTKQSANRLVGIPLTTQQTSLRQPISVFEPQGHSALKCSYLPPSEPSTTVPVSRALTKFIPRSVIQASRSPLSIRPPLKRRKEELLSPKWDWKSLVKVGSASGTCGVRLWAFGCHLHRTRAHTPPQLSNCHRILALPVHIWCDRSSSIIIPLRIYGSQRFYVKEKIKTHLLNNQSWTQ